MATFCKYNDPSAAASTEGELSVTILCCTNFDGGSFAAAGCRRKRYRVQVEFGMREFKTMWDNGASSSCAVWDQSFRAYINSSVCQNMRIIVKSAHVVKPKLVGYADINLSDALRFRECHISTPIYKEGNQTCTVSAIVRFIPLSELQSIASAGSLTLPCAPVQQTAFSFHAKSANTPHAIIPGAGIYPSSPGFTTSNNTSPRSMGQLSDTTSTSGVVDPFVRCRTMGGSSAGPSCLKGSSAPCSPAAAAYGMYGCIDSATAMMVSESKKHPATPPPPPTAAPPHATAPLPTPAPPHIVPLTATAPPVRHDSLAAASCKGLVGSRASTRPSSRSVSEDGQGSAGLMGVGGTNRATAAAGGGTMGGGTIGTRPAGAHVRGGSSGSSTPSGTPRRRTASVERLTVPTISSLNKQQQPGGVLQQQRLHKSGSSTPATETPTTPRRGGPTSKPPTSPRAHTLHAACVQLAGVLTSTVQGAAVASAPGSLCTTPTAGGPARIRTAPTTPSHTKALQHTSQPDSPTGHWFQHTTKATPRSGHVSSGTPKRNAQDLDRILQRVSTLVAPAPIDPHADEPRETVLPPALAAQFSPLARSATQLLVHYSAGAGTGTASGAASTSACAPPAAVGPCAEDALCGVYIPPWQGGDEEDGTPFAYGSPLARGASGGGVAHAQGPFGAFQEAYRPAAVSLMRRLFGRA